MLLLFGAETSCRVVCFGLIGSLFHKFIEERIVHIDIVKQQSSEMMNEGDENDENGDGDAATLKKFYFMTYDIKQLVQCLFHRLVQSCRNHRIERDRCLWFL